MIKRPCILVAITAFVCSGPVLAESSTEKAVEAAAMEVAEAAEAAVGAAIEDAKDAYPRNPLPRDGYWRWIREADYPPEAYVADAEGSVGYELDVDAGGKPTACRVTSTSGHASLDSTLCSLMLEQASFEPALDDSGNAVSGTFGGEYSWRIRKPEFSAPLVIEVAYTTDERGRRTSCEVLRAEGELPRGFQDRPCPGSEDREGPPHRDEQGRPVAKRIILKLEASVSNVEESED